MIEGNQKLYTKNDRNFFSSSKNKALFKRAIIVSLVVGTILNLIYQGSAIVNIDFSRIDWLRFLLTYCVPFVVSAYSSYLANKG